MGTRHWWRVAALAIALCAAAALAGCGGGGDGAGGSGIEPPPSKQQTFSPSGGDKGERLVIASGSENREAAGAIQMAADESGVTVEMRYERMATSTSSTRRRRSTP